MTAKSPSIYEQAREIIRARSRDIIESLFSSDGANWKNGEYWTRCPYRADSDIGSFSINGATGQWLDFAGSGDGSDKGDLIDLIGLANNYGKKSRKAAELIVEQFGCGDILPASAAPEKKHEEIIIETPPITHICPEFPTEPDYITQYVPGFVIARWDAKGQSDKVIRPFTYNSGKWVSKRPSGWLPLAPFDKSRQVVIVEGEKCYMLATAADVNATTWHGGAQSVKRADWSALTGLDVVIWPDNDEPGHGAADWLQNHLAEIAASISRVIPDEKWPEKYDIADALADSIDVGRIIFDARKIVKTEIVPPAAAVSIPREKFAEYTTLENPPALQKIEEITDAIRDLSGKKQGDLSAFACVRYLIDLDYDFKWLVRWDDAKRQICFSDNYNTVDEIYTAILNRCALYKMSISMQTRRDVVDTIISRPQNRFNSILDELAKIEAEYPDEDADKLLDEWMGHFIVDGRDLNDIEHMETIENHREIWRIWFTKTAAHLHGAFTKYAQLPADIVPVLVGPQGCGKSTLCKLLSMDENRFYVDLGDKTGRDLGTPDCLRLISGMIVAELGEMISLRKSEIETVKSFISATEDAYTPKYKEGKLQIPRTASFIGTSNPEQFLQDMTGNRRFYPLKIRAVSRELTLGEFGRRHVRKMYAAFSKIGRALVADGRQAVMDACRPSDGLEKWLAGARDQATDTPVVVERIMECVADLEFESAQNNGFDRAGRKTDYCKMVAWEIAEKVFGAGQGTRADRNFGRWCGKVLEDRGYEKSTIKKNGCTMRGWKKPLALIMVKEAASES